MERFRKLRVYLGGMCGCFGAVVGAPRVRDVVSTLHRCRNLGSHEQTLTMSKGNWVYLGGMSVRFGTVVGALRVRDVVSTLPRCR